VAAETIQPWLGQLWVRTLFLNLVTITRRRERRCMRIQRIARRMSSPLLFHNRQFLMATAGGSVDKPIEEAIRGKVSILLHRYPAPDPPVVSAQ
jgi:hypothetical protein